MVVHLAMMAARERPVRDRYRPVTMDLARLGWDDDLAARWAEAHLDADAAPARVVRTSRRFTYVANEAGLTRAMAPLDLEPAPVSGDWVALRHDPDRPDDDAEVAAVLPRRSQLTRLDPSGHADEQVLAANVDTVFAVFGLDRPVAPGRLERSLVIAWDSGATPVVVLTKADAVADAAEHARSVAALAGDAEVVTTSSVTGEGIDALRAHLAGNHTAVLLGTSGAGKSTLVNHLAGTEVQRTAEVRTSDAKGRHTTVTRDLIVLDDGGVVIDTPGLRSLGLLDAGTGLAAAFDDIEELSASCRFRNCSHAREPGCAVRAAVDEGALDAERFGRYLQLCEELDEADEKRVDADRRASRTGRPPQPE